MLRAFFEVLRVAYRLVRLGPRANAVMEQQKFWSDQAVAAYDDALAARERGDLAGVLEAKDRFYLAKRRMDQETIEIFGSLPR